MVESQKESFLTHSFYFPTKPINNLIGLIYDREVAYVGHIGTMVRNDLDHKKKYQNAFFIKLNLGFFINYRSLRIFFSYSFTFFYISSLMRAPRFLH